MSFLGFFNKKEIFPIGLILVLAFSRIIPHPPNFTPLIAMAIISGYLFKNRYISLFVLLFSMLLGDLLIGFYDKMIFTYLALLIINFLSFELTQKINFKNLFFFCIAGSLVFYLITNFIVWYSGTLYEQNISGLITCYVLAIPFFNNTLISTIIFSYLAFTSIYYANLTINTKK